MRRVGLPCPGLHDLDSRHQAAAVHAAGTVGMAFLERKQPVAQDGVHCPWHFPGTCHPSAP